MQNKRTYYKCKTCGNIVGMIENSGVIPVCCGNEMTVLTADTVEGTEDHHIPVVDRDGKKLTVTIGKVPHPMTKEHHIGWVEIAQGDLTQRMMLQQDEQPKATFYLDDKPMIIYAYCNLHGLWSTEI